MKLRLSAISAIIVALLAVAVVGQDAQNPVSEPPIKRVHVLNPGEREYLSPNLIGIQNIAMTFLPLSMNFINVIDAFREIVDGVRYEILLNAIDTKNNNAELVCRLVILEKPWLTTEWGDKVRELRQSNCTSDADNLTDPMARSKVLNDKYTRNAIFNGGSRNELPDDEMAKLEAQIIAFAAGGKTSSSSKLGVKSTTTTTTTEIPPPEATTIIENIEPIVEVTPAQQQEKEAEEQQQQQPPSIEHEQALQVNWAEEVNTTPAAAEAEAEAIDGIGEAQRNGEDGEELPAVEVEGKEDVTTVQPSELSDVEKKWLDDFYSVGAVNFEHSRRDSHKENEAVVVGAVEAVGTVGGAAPAPAPAPVGVEETNEYANGNGNGNGNHEEDDASNNYVQPSDYQASEQHGHEHEHKYEQQSAAVQYEIEANADTHERQQPLPLPLQQAVGGGGQEVEYQQQQQSEDEYHQQQQQQHQEQHQQSEHPQPQEYQDYQQRQLQSPREEEYQQQQQYQPSDYQQQQQQQQQQAQPLSEDPIYHRQSFVGEVGEEALHHQQESARFKRDTPNDVVGGETEMDPVWARERLEESLQQLAAGDGPNYRISKIISARTQVVAGTLSKIEADLINGDAESTNEQQTERCHIEIWSRPWLPNGVEVTVDCPNKEPVQARYTRSVIEHAEKKTHKKHNHHSLDKAEHLFSKFQIKYNRRYHNTMERQMRLRIFRQNLKTIEELNRNEMGSAKYGITEFADMTTDEYKMRTGLWQRDEGKSAAKGMAEIPDIELPKEFDWREKGAITPVKNQGSCGSCWAFSVTGNIEGLHAVKTGKLEEYSEQELLDCDTVDSACNGGLPDNAYQAIEQIGGLELESEYPYKGKKQQCTFNKALAHVKVKGFVDLPKNETAMAQWLIANGPISIGINANAMQFYRGGVSHPWHALCSKKNLDHGVLIVGYGVSDYPNFKKTLPYWIVKNSWGSKWGEQGYYRVYRGDNTCGLSEMASSAILD